ncbi:MAG: hypothetical protein ABSB15_00170 [Bryobacteraceae bacterium]
MNALPDSEVPAAFAAAGWHGFLRPASGAPDGSLERDLGGYAFQTAQESSCRALGVKPAEVVTAAFLVFGPIADDRPRDGQNPVRDRDRGFLQSAPMRDPVEHGGKKTIPRTCRSPCALYQDAADVAVALTSAAREPLSRAFRVAGA